MSPEDLREVARQLAQEGEDRGAAEFFLRADEVERDYRRFISALVVFVCTIKLLVTLEWMVI